MSKRASILIVIFLFSVSLSPAQASVPPCTSIYLRRFADAFNNGNDYDLTIKSDGTVVFKRFANPFVDQSASRAKALESIESKIGVDQIAMLVAEFERIKFFSLNDRYAKTEDGCPSEWTDAGGAEVSITLNGKSKTVHHYHGCRELNSRSPYPVELTALEAKIDEVVGTKRWLKP